MTVQAWLEGALADSTRRGLPQLRPLLEGLAASLTQLRAADFSPGAAPRDAVTPAGPNVMAEVLRHAPGASPVAPAAPAASAGAHSASPAVATRPARIALPTSAPTIQEFTEQLRAGRTSSVAATEACLAAIADKDGALNAFIAVTRDEALARARQADAELAAGHDRGPLHGVPISLKDLFDVRGVATTAASNVRRHDVAASDCPAVIHLRQAGAVIVGKTNLHEFAFGTTNEDSGFGAAHHPLDVSRSPGGSSGGSAISVATGMSLGTLGTDTGGSIRIPAAACGLVGLKPTSGEVSADGVVPLSTTLDHVGPLARTVTDAWHLYQALIGHPSSRPLTPSPLSGLRIGIPHRYFCDLLEPDVRAAFDAAVAAVERAGARVAHVDLSHADYIATIYLQIVFAEAAAYHAATLEKMAERYTEPVRLRLEMARYVLAEDYLRAMAGRQALQREVDAALSWHDVLLLPTLPIAAPPIGAATVTINGAPHPVRNLMLRLTQLFNITGHPAVSLPCGHALSGLPVGLQLVGRRHETDVLMHIALGVERELGVYR